MLILGYILVDNTMPLNVTTVPILTPSKNRPCIFGTAWYEVCVLSHTARSGIVSYVTSASEPT